MVRNGADWKKWKDSGMIGNRYRPVITHRKLIKMVEADDLDMNGIRAVLKELINIALPVTEDEMEVIMRIEAEHVAHPESTFQTPQTE